MELKSYINDQIARGKSYFTIDNAYKELPKSRNAIRLSISHLISSGEIVSVAKGFYVIIPPEYRVLGCIPADQFVPYLMEYLGYKYYAALITAASYYGASHQAPQVFQVMTNVQLRAITCGKVKIQFIETNKIDNVPTNSISTAKSRLIISTPEATALDLFRFLKQSGGLNNVATILAELKEKIDAEKFKSIIEQQSGLAWKQRLGYVLEFIHAKDLANIIRQYLSKQSRVVYIPLSPSLKKSNKIKKNETWKIIENTKVELDI